MKHLYNIICLLALLLVAPAAYAQKNVKVHGTYSYAVGENENITLAEVKRKCIQGAQNEAIKTAFGIKIDDIVEMSDIDVNGSALSSFYQEVSMSSFAEWIRDTQEPEINVTYTNEQLVFYAEVWGEAREITKAKTDIIWDTYRNGNSESCRSRSYKNGDQLYVKFRSPISGSVAVYYLDGSDKYVYRMLPYLNSESGIHNVKGGKDYVFFDRDIDPAAGRMKGIKINKDEPFGIDELIVIFSPNGFVMNNDHVDKDVSQLPRQDYKSFERWLSKLRKQDQDIVIQRNHWITVVNENKK